MATIQQGMRVCFNYILTLVDGQVVDQSEEGSPLCYVHGSGSIISGLEKALEGMAPGETKQVLVPAAQAYGEYEPDLIERLPRNLFPEDVEVGMGFRMRNEAGQVLTVYVDTIGDEWLDVNLSHPLTGKDLNFHVQITEVREATEDELRPSGCGCGCSDDCGTCH